MAKDEKPAAQAEVVEDVNISAVLAEDQGASTKQFFILAPDMMRELTTQLIKHKDIRVRERIRAQMKSIFGAILADTEYPKNTGPVEEKKKERFDEVV